MTREQRDILMTALDHMWIPEQPPGLARDVLTDLAARGFMEPAGKQFDDAPAGALSITESGSKAVGY